MGHSLNMSLSVVRSLCLALLALSATSCSRSRAEKFGPLPEAQTRPFRACHADQDCEFVTNGCCDCMNGGEELAINKAQHEQFRAQFDCKQPLGCTEIGGVCGDGTSRCESGLCTYRPAK